MKVYFVLIYLIRDMIENSLFTFINIKVINIWYKRPWVRGNDEIDQILKKEKKNREDTT